MTSPLKRLSLWLLCPEACYVEPLAKQALLPYTACQGALSQRQEAALGQQVSFMASNRVSFPGLAVTHYLLL